MKAQSLEMKVSFYFFDVILVTLGSIAEDISKQINSFGGITGSKLPKIAIEACSSSIRWT